MKTTVYAGLILVIILTSGCLSEENDSSHIVPDPNFPSQIIGYSCQSLEGSLYLQNGKIYSTNGSSCSFSSKNPDLSVPYFLDGVEEIKNLKNQLIIETECKNELGTPYSLNVISLDVIVASDNRLYTCTGHAGT